MRDLPNYGNVYNYNYNADYDNNNGTNYPDDSDEQDYQIDQRTAMLAITGGVIGTVASIISTYTAYLALKDIDKSRQKQIKANARIADLENQVRYLMQQSQNRT